MYAYGDEEIIHLRDAQGPGTRKTLHQGDHRHRINYVAPIFTGPFILICHLHPISKAPPLKFFLRVRPNKSAIMIPYRYRSLIHTRERTRTSDIPCHVPPWTACKRTAMTARAATLDRLPLSR
jgi:hypothetical protein